MKPFFDADICIANTSIHLNPVDISLISIYPRSSLAMRMMYSERFQMEISLGGRKRDLL